MSQGPVPVPVEDAAEKAVLGSIFLDPDVYYQVAGSLKSQDFHNPFYAAVFESISGLVARGQAIDEISVEKQLRANKGLRLEGDSIFTNLCEIQQSTPTAKNVMMYLDIVLEASRKRQVIKIGVDMQIDAKAPGASSEEVIASSAQALLDLSVQGKGVSEGVGVKEGIDLVLLGIDRRMESSSGVTGLSTGLTELDDLIDGLQKSMFYIIGARPSMGKTTLLMDFARSVFFTAEYPVLLFSLEMPAQSLYEKLLSALSSVPLDKIKKATMDDDDWASFSGSCSQMLEVGDKLIIEDSSNLTPAMMSGVARKHYMKHGGLSMIGIDYLQLMNVPSAASSDNRNLELSEISRSLKALAKELSVPLVALSQLNRSLEKRNDKRPINSDLRESGSLEQDADVLMFVYRDEVYDSDSADKGIAEIIVGKQREGALGTVRVASRLDVCKFCDLVKF